MGHRLDIVRDIVPAIRALGMARGHSALRMVVLGRSGSMKEAWDYEMTKQDWMVHLGSEVEFRWDILLDLGPRQIDIAQYRSKQ